MPIIIQCPGCKKKLKAKDQMAGKQVKCPSCGEFFVLPATRRVPKTRPSSSDPFIQAIARGKDTEIARFIRKLDFTLIETPEASSGEGKAALMAEVGDFSALVAFPSRDHAMRFAGVMPGLLDGGGSMPIFIVAGIDLLRYMPEGCGLLLNPETDDSAVVAPRLVDRMRSLG